MDYCVVNLGQVKNVAKPFYDRLIQIGYSTAYPWTTSTTPASDYQMAAIGQVKNLFTFDFSDTNSNGLPDWWEMKYFGNLTQTGTGSFLGDGMSNQQKYLAGIDPVAPYTPVTGALNPNATTGRFSRGYVLADGTSQIELDGTSQGDSSCASFVIPLDGEKGIPLDPMGANTGKFPGQSPWFMRIAKTLRDHNDSYYSSSNIIIDSPIQFENPIVAFGAGGGGSPMYLNQSYNFGVYAGGRNDTTSPVIFISAYKRSKFVPGQTQITPDAVQSITIPVQSNAVAWSAFAQNGFKLSVQANGLNTDIQLVEADNWTGQWDTNPASPYIITHTATSLDYYYKVEVFGYVPSTWLGQNIPMVVNDATQAPDNSSHVHPSISRRSRRGDRHLSINRNSVERQCLPPITGKHMMNLSIIHLPLILTLAH